MHKKFGMKALGVAAAAVLAVGVAPAIAQKPRPESKTPSSWSYDIKDGKRVPKAQRQVNADGSWREEVRQGSCVTVREKSATGEYRETRQC